jgi:hypothetical protein
LLGFIAKPIFTRTLSALPRDGMVNFDGGAKARGREASGRVRIIDFLPFY